MNILLSCIGKRCYIADYFRDALPGGSRIIGTSNTSWTPGFASCDEALTATSTVMAKTNTCAIGNPKVRREYSDMIRVKGGKFATLIEPCSRVGRVAGIGDGSLIGPFCAVSCDLSIGADTMITAHVTIGHDVTIGRSCHIGAYAFIGGGAVIGDEVTVHPHAVILPGLKIGNRSVVGAGAVVMSDVANGSSVFGVPAQRLAN